MTLTCPECGNNKSFTTLGIPGKIQCVKCGITFPIDGNYTETKE